MKLSELHVIDWPALKWEAGFNVRQRPQGRVDRVPVDHSRVLGEQRPSPGVSGPSPEGPLSYKI